MLSHLVITKPRTNLRMNKIVFRSVQVGLIYSEAKRSTGTELLLLSGLSFEIQNVNGDAAESFRNQSVVKGELVLFYNEGVSNLYTSVADTHPPICSRQQQTAAEAVEIDVSYPHSGPSVVWLLNSLLWVSMNDERWQIDVVSHSGSVAEIFVV